MLEALRQPVSKMSSHTDFDQLRSPVRFLENQLANLPCGDILRGEEPWWSTSGRSIGEAIDRAGTPWLRMFNRFGVRVDDILYPPEYQALLRRGYRAGVVWRALEEKSLIPTYLLIYAMSYHEPGICCPYTVSLGTAIPLAKYGTPDLQARFLPRLLQKDDSVWQGATWMTEIRGGSDLGAAVETAARNAGYHWLLTGDKYFASNVGAELAVVAARPEGAPDGVRGLALFLVPRYRENGELNYFIRRLKDKIATRSVPTGEVELRDSEAYRLGSAESGIYQILEVLNVSRIANSVVAVSLAQRTIAEALAFAERRMAFGKRIFDHPLLHGQFERRFSMLQRAFALVWKSVELLNEVWLERPPYSDRYHLFRLLAHLAKYWTAEFAIDTAKWNMEVHGGLGVLAEYGMDRWLREAMILAIWEGTSHRQILDAIEVMQRKHAHRMLFELLAKSGASAESLRKMESRIDAHLQLPAEERESRAEPIVRELAEYTAECLASGR